MGPGRSAFAHLLGPLAPFEDPDERFLALAFDEALRGSGRTAPNPPVGAVVVRDGAVIARGFHARAGASHAEIAAIDAFGGGVRGATLYVTLEPCAHHGRTPPCVDRVLAEGIARVVVGSVDPNPRVHGRGIERLRESGVVVDVAAGPVADACRALLLPFARSIREGRPWVVLKTAASLDGRIATGNGASRWVTHEASRALVHRLRDQLDAVVVGAGTIRADDPALTARLDGGRDPLRVVIDGSLSSYPEARAFQRAAGGPRPVVVCARADAERKAVFERAGVEVRVHPGKDGHVDLASAFRGLLPAAMSVLVEAGPGLATALLRAGLIDELWWFQAPVVLGADARPAFGALGLDAPADAPRFEAVHAMRVGPDALSVLLPTRAPAAIRPI